MMEFFKCSIGGVVYGTGTTEVQRAAAVRTGNVTPPPKVKVDFNPYFPPFLPPLLPSPNPSTLGFSSNH